MDLKTAIDAIAKRYDEAASGLELLEPGVNDDSVLEAERDTLEWVLGTLAGVAPDDTTELTNGSTLLAVIVQLKGERARATSALATARAGGFRAVPLKVTQSRYDNAVGKLQGALNMARLLGYKD